VAIAIGLAFPMSAANADVTWRMATKQPSDSVEGKAFQYFADKVKEYSGGKMTIKIYPSEQLGKTEAALEQVKAGTVHIYPEGASYLKKWVSDMSYMSAPFMFDNREHWARFMESDLLSGWLKQVEDKAGITLIGNPAAFMRGPYRVMVTKKPWTNMAELKGIKLRHHPNQLGVDVWTNLGLEVRVLGWTEVYESIQRGIVEAVNSPIALVEAMKFYEVAPNIVRHNEYPQGIGFMTNAKAYNGLPADLREAVDRAYEEAGKYSVELTMEVTDKSIARMKEKGVTYNEPDTSDIIKAMQEFYSALDKAGKLPKGFVETVNKTRTGG
jgi:TRAP-type C4-dicarboxylate transport system substrate-binding protein